MKVTHEEAVRTVGLHDVVHMVKGSLRDSYFRLGENNWLVQAEGFRMSGFTDGDIAEYITDLSDCGYTMYFEGMMA